METTEEDVTPESLGIKFGDSKAVASPEFKNANSPYLVEGYGSEFPDAGGATMGEVLNAAKEPFVKVSPKIVGEMGRTAAESGLGIVFGIPKYVTDLGIKMVPKEMRDAAAKKIAEQASSATSPLGIATLAVPGMIGPKAAAAVFGALSAAQLGAGAGTAYEGAKQGDLGLITEGGIDAATGVLGLAGATKLGRGTPLGDTGIVVKDIPRLPQPGDIPPITPEARALLPMSASAVEGTSTPKSAEPPTTPEPSIPATDQTIGEGPGAHTAGAAPLSTGTQLQQLTSTIEGTQPSPPGTYGLKAKFERATEAAKDWMKTVVDPTPALEQLGKLRAKSAALIDDYKNPPRWNGLDEATGRWSLADQESSLDARRFTQEIEKAIPDKTRREAIVNYIQADGDDAILASRAALSNPKLAKGYETARHLTPDEIVQAHQIGTYFDARLGEAQAAGIMEHGIDNYITQVWDRENPVTKSIRGDMGLGKLQTDFKFARKRLFDSYFEGEQAGFAPKNKDVGALIALYDQSLNRSISGRAYVKQIYEGKMPNGERMATLQGTGQQVQMPLQPNQLVNDRPYFIKPDSMNATTKDGRPYIPIDHPAMRKWKWVAKAPDTQDNAPSGSGLTANAGNVPGGRNYIYLQADMAVHPDIYPELRNVLGKSSLRDENHPIGQFTKPLLDLQMTAKQTKLDLSAFHLVQEAIHAGGHRTSPLTLEPIDLNAPLQAGLVKHGLQVADYRASELFAEGLSGGNRSLLQKIPGAGAVLGKWNDFLFKDFIPELKMKTALAILKRNTELYAGKMNDDQLMALSAQQANAAYGELNYRMMYRNPTFQDILRLGLLAPDFLEARGKVIGQALKPYGHEQRMNLALIAGTMYVGARILNKTLDGDYHWDKPFSVVSDKKEYRVRTLVGDLQHLATDQRSFIYGRLSPASRIGTEALTGRDDRGLKRTYVEQFKDAVGWSIPISLAQVPGSPTRRDDVTPGQAVLGSMGVTAASNTASKQIGKLAVEWAKNNPDKKISHAAALRDIEAMPDSDYRPIRAALEMGRKQDFWLAYSTLTDEQGKTRRQISDYFAKPRLFTGSAVKERDFKNSLSVKDRKTYDEAVNEHKQLNAKFKKMTGQ